MRTIPVARLGARRRSTIGRRSTRGRTLSAVVFFLVGFALMALPFFGSPIETQWVEYTGDEEDWTVKDPGRNPDTDIPYEVDVTNFDLDFEGEFDRTLRNLIEEELDERYAMDAPLLWEGGVIDARRLPAGRTQFMSTCSGCHGPEGDGGGPAARYLNPRPRNYWKGRFKFTSTDSGQRPTRKDLHGIIVRGLAGSSMPSFALYPDERLWDVVEYVRYLAVRGEFRQKMLDIAWEDEELPDPAEVAEIVETAWHPDTTRPVFPPASEPPADEASIARGLEVFMEPSTAQCYQCHGETGKGDGPNADEFSDDWGYPIRPRDFTAGVFRAGEEAKDLYMSIATGIGGTPMGSYSQVIQPEDIWHLVHYVQSLAKQ